MYTYIPSLPSVPAGADHPTEPCADLPVLYSRRTISRDKNRDTDIENRQADLGKGKVGRVGRLIFLNDVNIT